MFNCCNDDNMFPRCGRGCGRCCNEDSDRDCDCSCRRRRGPTSPTGAAGATGATGATVMLSGIQIELTGGANTLIGNTGTIVFDTILNNPSSDISYNSSIGLFKLQRPETIMFPGGLPQTAQALALPSHLL